MKKRLIPSILIVSLILAAFIFSAIPIGATSIPDPDSAPSIDDTRVYRNMIETGDILIVWEANIPYTTTPGIPVTQAFIWRLLAMDGVTVLGTTTGYAYNDDGYGYNVYSLYFPASTAPTWGEPYTLQLTGNPSAFTTPPVYNFTLATGEYTTLTDSTDNQVALATFILTLADDLGIKWALTTDYKLTTSSETGTVLSLYGEDFFRGAIYGLQSLAPAAFGFVITDINAPDRSWNATYVSSLEHQYDGTWVETARNASSDFMGTDYDLTSLIIILIACAVLLFSNMALGGNHWDGLIDAAFLMVIAARLGFIGLVIDALIAAICIVYIGTKFWRMIPT